MTSEELRNRTKAFAIRVVRMYKLLPPGNEAQVLGKQVLRSATSIGANYRAACRARSRAEFSAKLGLVLEEADETAYWLELLTESGIVSASRIGELQKEANELTAIFASSRITVRGKQNGGAS